MFKHHVHVVLELISQLFLQSCLQEGLLSDSERKLLVIAKFLVHFIDCNNWTLLIKQLLLLTFL